MDTATRADADIHIRPDVISIEMLQRHFGVSTLDPGEFAAPCPPEIEAIAAELIDHSRLLELESQAKEGKVELTKQMVIEAYDHDITMFNRCVKSFLRFLENVVTCSITAKRIEQAQECKDKLWAHLQEEMRAYTDQPLIFFDFHLAANSPLNILGSLASRVQKGAEYVARMFTFWLQLMVDRELVGLVEWTAEDVARYHYFLYINQEEVLKESQGETTVEVDESRPFGEQTIYTTRGTRVIRQQEATERHMHHIVNAKTDTLESFSDQVPGRIAELLEGAPYWLRPHLRIVSGNIILEEVARRQTKDQVRVENTISVFKGSPAVAIGNFALAGWSTDDMRAQARHYHLQQEAEKQSKASALRETVSTVAILAAVIVVIGLAIYWIHYSMVRDANQFRADKAAYVADLDAEQAITTTLDEPLMLEDVEPQLIFSGVADDGSLSRHIRIRIADEVGKERLVPYRFRIPNYYYATGPYGDVPIDFGDGGAVVTLHIISAKEPSEITYTYTLPPD